MESLSFTQVFGEGAFPNENLLAINKASLLRLTPTANNTAESLLVAILINTLQNFQGIVNNENNQPIIDEFNQNLIYDNSEAFELLKMIEWKPFIFTINGQQYIIHQILIEIYAAN